VKKNKLCVTVVEEETVGFLLRLHAFLDLEVCVEDPHVLLRRSLRHC
jgi:hypothetical protein